MQELCNFQMTTTTQVTNYRFRKSMGWEIKASLLYQAYVQISEGMGMFSDSGLCWICCTLIFLLWDWCILLISICICILMSTFKNNDPKFCMQKMRLWAFFCCQELSPASPSFPYFHPFDFHPQKTQGAHGDAWHHLRLGSGPCRTFVVGLLCS